MSDEPRDEGREIYPESLGEGEAEAVAVGAESERAGGRLEVPPALPVLPLKNTVIYPFLLAPLLVNTTRSKRLIDHVLLTSDRMFITCAVRHATEGSPEQDDVYPVGTVVRVMRMLKFPDGSYRLLIQGVTRARVTAFDASPDAGVPPGERPFLHGRVQRLSDTGETDSVEVAALMRNVAEQFGALVSESPRLSDELQALSGNVEEPSKLADLVASNLELDVAGKQAVLEELDVPDRLRRVLAEINRSRQVSRIEGEIREKVQNEMGKTQREYMLRQQLEAIRRELGDAEEEGAEADQLQERIEAAGLPEEAYEQATRELDRLRQMPPSSAEHGVIRTYLEWLADLPWSQGTEDQLDVERARKILDEDHHGLEKVKDRILEYIAVLSLKRDLRGPILCFSGPPGTGKTSLGRSIARALGREFVRISLGGVRDEAEIRGHRRTYVGALPGRIVQGLRRAGSRNPVFLLDELDKVGTDFRGDPASALLEVLDPEQNDTFSDHYLEVPFDLSQVLFIATANWMDTVPPALRDRMEVIELPGYTAEEKVEIARRFLVPRQREANGLVDVDVEIAEDTLRALVRSYTREAGVRNLEREIGAVCRKVARRVAEGRVDGPIRVAPEDLAELLGPVRFEPELAERAGRPGVAVGLAWTPAGGDILFVESTRMPGKGGLKLTGSLGDVMRESAEAARSWLRANADGVGLDPGSFADSELHVHVPAGAVPKDGPSAGVAMVTSLASLLTGRSAHPDVAMTGEITLRGKVLPVGGIKEKVLAARRAGIRRVVLPERNRKDAEEISEALLKDLELEYVGTIDEALAHTRAARPSPRAGGPPRGAAGGAPRVAAGGAVSRGRVAGLRQPRHPRPRGGRARSPGPGEGAALAAGRAARDLERESLLRAGAAVGPDGGPPPAARDARARGRPARAHPRAARVGPGEPGRARGGARRAPGHLRRAGGGPPVGGRARPHAHPGPRERRPDPRLRGRGPVPARLRRALGRGYPHPSHGGPAAPQARRARGGARTHRRRAHHRGAGAPLPDQLGAGRRAGRPGGAHPGGAGRPPRAGDRGLPWRARPGGPERHRRGSGAQPAHRGPAAASAQRRRGRRHPVSRG